MYFSVLIIPSIAQIEIVVDAHMPIISWMIRICTCTPVYINKLEQMWLWNSNMRYSYITLRGNSI